MAERTMVVIRDNTLIFDDWPVYKMVHQAWETIAQYGVMFLYTGKSSDIYIYIIYY